MGGDFEREYRGRVAAGKILPYVGLMLALGVAEVAINDVPIWFALILLAFLSTSACWVGLLLTRGRTVVRASGIAVYGAVRVRKWAWHDIENICVEPVPDIGRSGPRHHAYLYDRAGRRTTLVYVNDQCLPYSLGAEARFLQDRLASSRGVA